ncbi:targeting protein for Xklp2 isoform X1 [Callorhinchus milii]|uniref:targeting protein for Xklp2 isoform X1 n=1 Tax=Callorhinchus milii TaxID=7868 RepID=UPI001C3F5554|nr:targeting protein for Xklp2 isoform X1 [Callorhinchus milii]
MAAWNYDAPTHIDFCNLDDQDDLHVDYWFDKQAENEVGINQATPPAESKNLVVQLPHVPCKSSLVQAAQSPKGQLLPKEGESAEEQIDGTVGSVPSNVVTSLSVWRTTSAAPARGTPVRRSARRPPGQVKKQLAELRADRRFQDPATGAPVSKKAKLNPKAKTSVSRVGSLRQSQSSAQTRQAMPSTPTVLKRQQHMGAKGKSTEELEMEKISQFQKEFAEQRKLNEETLKAAICGTSQHSKLMRIPATKPMDIQFHTDKRIKAHGETQVYKEVNFTNELRKHPQSPMRALKGSTVPKPFNLSCGSKRKHTDMESKAYVSVAQQVEEFQRRTPSRYHLRSKQLVEEGPHRVPMKMKLTKPLTPLLTTKGRAREATCKSTAEIEADEVEKIQSYRFKAQELNPRILEGGPIVPKKPPVKEPTEPIGFRLETDNRIRKREENRKPEDQEQYLFHPRPCPIRILEDVVGVPEKRKLPLTVPHSPVFAVKSRVRIPLKEEQEEKLVKQIKINTMPHCAVPFKPKPLEEKNVEIQPFSFEARDKERQTLKEKKLQEIRKEMAEVPTFKAQPLPDFDLAQLPEKVVKSPTKLQPFHLRIEERGVVRAERWTQMMKEELRQQKEAACFKANPSSAIYREPFVPKKAERSLTEKLSASVVQESFELATEKRAKERMEFEKYKADKEVMREQAEQEKQNRKEEQERKEIAQLRHDQIHKANPVRHYKKVEIQPSEQQLTVPTTPNFSDRFRL